MGSRTGLRIRIPDKGGSRRKYGTPTARRPYHLFSMGAAAPTARSAPPSFQMVGMARRRRPKIQARSGVSAGCKGGFAAKVGADGASPSRGSSGAAAPIARSAPPSF